jgi:hypothetical protein
LRCRICDHNAVAGAFGRVDLTDAAGELAKLRFGLSHLSDPLMHLVEALCDELRDVFASGLAAVLDVEDLTDLAQGEPGSLGDADEAHSVERVRPIVG